MNYTIYKHGRKPEVKHFPLYAPAEVKKQYLQQFLSDVKEICEPYRLKHVEAKNNPNEAHAVGEASKTGNKLVLSRSDLLIFYKNYVLAAKDKKPEVYETWLYYFQCLKYFSGIFDIEDTEWKSVSHTTRSKSEDGDIYVFWTQIRPNLSDIENVMLMTEHTGPWSSEEFKEMWKNYPGTPSTKKYPVKGNPRADGFYYIEDFRFV